jgi:hypothetical protein
MLKGFKNLLKMNLEKCYRKRKAKSFFSSSFPRFRPVGPAPRRPTSFLPPLPLPPLIGQGPAQAVASSFFLPLILFLGQPDQPQQLLLPSTSLSLADEQGPPVRRLPPSSELSTADRNRRRRPCSARVGVSPRLGLVLRERRPRLPPPAAVFLSQVITQRQQRYVESTRRRHRRSVRLSPPRC